ncbi:hypothetical protein KC622_01325, partial [Candidatus Dojkabacteria bacterium]|nr:hypothetical protein [Candidatus Dojkabacteria bacterium]
GSATMQALEEAHLREIVEVLPSNPAEDIVKIVFYRTELDTVLEALKSRLVSELAWVKFTGNEKTYVIFRDKLLVGSLKNNVFINKVQNYAKSLGLNDNLILLNK